MPIVLRSDGSLSFGKSGSPLSLERALKELDRLLAQHKRKSRPAPIEIHIETGHDGSAARQLMLKLRPLLTKDVLPTVGWPDGGAALTLGPLKIEYRFDANSAPIQQITGRLLREELIAQREVVRRALIEAQQAGDAEAMQKHQQSYQVFMTVYREVNQRLRNPR
jgi:hypothetical protein